MAFNRYPAIDEQGDFPDEVRLRWASNLVTSGTPEANALAAVVGSSVAEQIIAEDIPSQVADAVAAAPTVVAAAVTAVGEVVEGLQLVEGILFPGSSEWAIPLQDEDGYNAGGVLKTGDVLFYRLLHRPGSISVVAFDETVPFSEVIDSDYALPFPDEDGFISGGLLKTGTWRFERPPEGIGAPGTALEIARIIATLTRSNAYRFFALGDSLTQGYSNGGYWPLSDAWPAHLDGFPEHTTVFNRGESGQTIDEMSIRFGALVPIAQAGFTIPADLSAVPVTVQSGIGWRPTRTWEFEGSFLGVPGVLTRTDAATTSLTFRRSSAGATVAVPSGTPFVSSQNVHAGDVGIVFAGRNDISYGITGADASILAHVIAGYDRIESHLSPQIKNVLYVGTINSSAESSGSANYNIVTAINQHLETTYPGRFFDIRAYLVNEAIYDMGLTPDATDLSYIASGRIPPQLMDDGVHYSRATAAQVGKRFARWILERGWV